MKSFSKIVLATVATGFCAIAAAQPYDDADRARRERNREEVMAQHERMENRSSVREEVREGGNKVERKTRHIAHKTAAFTERQLDKVRNFGERQQRKFPANPHTTESDKSPTALGK